jgi:hypothetical protein
LTDPEDMALHGRSKNRMALLQEDLKCLLSMWTGSFCEAYNKGDRLSAGSDLFFSGRLLQLSQKEFEGIVENQDEGVGFGFHIESTPHPSGNDPKAQKALVCANNSPSHNVRTATFGTV